MGNSRELIRSKGFQHSFANRLRAIAGASLLLLMSLAPAGAGVAASRRQTALGHPAEGRLDIHLGEPQFEQQIVFDGGTRVREPYLAVAWDGTVLALRNRPGLLRRSTDGGRTWDPPREVPFGFMDSNMIVDENTGDILTVRMWEGADRIWRSRDHGRSWIEQEITLKPNEVMKWLERAELKVRGGRDAGSGDYYMHANASESGITLRHGKHAGRLLVSATFRPHADEHPSDRQPVDAIYSCAIFSDDGGSTWQVSGLFPDGYTEEAALAELHDGRIYYNSRSHRGYHDRAAARELAAEENLRREAWSDDGGLTWKGLRVNPVLPDGGGYGRGYGMKGGLVRLPIENRDILIYSNADTAGGAREKITVWASFDGGHTWPIQRRVDDGPGAYSSLAAGRPGTASEGQVFLLFEGVESGIYHGMQVARFNLAWVLGGQPTGDGQLPDWLNDSRFE